MRRSSGDEAELLETADLRVRERLARQIGECRAAPEAESLAEEPRRVLRRCVLRVGDEPLEAEEVELVRLHPDQVAAALVSDQVLGASAFRSWETWYWSAFAAARGGCAPQSSSISRSAETTSLAEVSSKTSSARSLDPLERERTISVDDLERSKDPELHACLQRRPLPARCRLSRASAVPQRPADRLARQRRRIRRRR